MIATPLISPRRERRKLKRAQKVLALAMTGLLLAPGAAVVADSFGTVAEAHALDFGPGLGDAISYWHANGTQLYCLEMGILPDTTNSSPALNGASVIPAYQSQWVMREGQTFYNVGSGAISSDSSQYKRLAYILAKYGSTQNNTQAAAVALATWSIRGEVGKVGDWDALFDFSKNSAGSAAVSSMNSMLSEAQAWLDAGGNSGGNAQAAEDPILSHSNGYQGTITLKSGTSLINLDNAVFEDGSSSKSFPGGLSQDAVFNWVGQPPADAEFGRYYRVTASGESVYYTYPPGTIYITPGDAFNQSTGYAQPGAPQEHIEPLNDVYIDPDTLWAPQLSTETPSEFVKRGETFADTVTFFASTDSPYNSWRIGLTSNLEERFAPITAKGTLYGPFLTDPALNPQSTPPVGAPVAGTAEVTTSSTQGPGTYLVDTNIVASETGYYSWVWNIDFNDQHSSVISPPNNEDPSIPDNYFFTDGFGQASEGQTVATKLHISTTLSANEIAIGGSFTDEVNVELRAGGWLRGDDGEKLPYRLTGTVYASESEPVQQAEAPADARVVATTDLVVNGTGDYTSQQLRVPLNTSEDYVTVQWCVDGANQPAGSEYMVANTCDDYGMPAETAKVLRPEVTTKAQKDGAIYGTIKDTAEVTGAMPDLPGEIDFTVFLKPEAGQPKFDENWQPVLDADGNTVLWTEAEVEDPRAVCEAQPVAKTDRVPVDGVGTYESPEVTAKSTGTVYWVEELFVEDPETGEDVSMHRGECGLPDETTYVEKPEVTTQAQEEAAVKGDFNDLAYISGAVPNVPMELDFTVYLKPEAGQPKFDENWQPVLDADGNTVLWTAEEVEDPEAVCEAQPVAKTDRVPADGAGAYASPAVRAETEGTVYWVEELFVQDPDTGEDVSLHRGECGLPNETTFVEKPKVTTKAVEEAFVGDEIFDTAIVKGQLSQRDEISYEVTFEAYHRAEGDTTAVNDALCTDDTKVWESTAPTPVTTTGEYLSQKWKVQEQHVGEILWVETLTQIERTEDGEIRTELHRGACGEVDEITKVKEKPALAVTGAGMIMTLIAGAGVLSIAAGVAMMIAQRRRQNAEATE